MNSIVGWSESCSVVSESLRPHGLYSSWDSPGKNTGLGSLSFSRGPSQPRDQTGVSCIAGGFFTNWSTREAPCKILSINIIFFLLSNNLLNIWIILNKRTQVFIMFLAFINVLIKLLILRPYIIFYKWHMLTIESHTY